MKILNCIILFVSVALLTACATDINQRSDSPRIFVEQTQPVDKITVTYSANGQDDLKDNEFDQSSLVKSVQNHLSAKNLYNSNTNGDTLEIQITAIRYRSTFNAIMWGFMSGSDNIRGEVYVRDSSGKLLNHFEVYAMYALGGFVGGLKDVRWEYLYDKFGELVVNNLSN